MTSPDKRPRPRPPTPASPSNGSRQTLFHLLDHQRREKKLKRKQIKGEPNMQLFKPRAKHEKLYTCQPRGLSHFTHTIRNNTKRFVLSLQPLVVTIIIFLLSLSSTYAAYFVSLLALCFTSAGLG